MLRIVTPLGLALAAFVIAGPSPAPAPAPAPASPFAPAAAPIPHCQVPCGIFGDKLRIDLMLEDVATIEKAMRLIDEISKEDSPNYNQLVRWITTKEEHAQKIQDQVATY